MARRPPLPALSPRSYQRITLIALFLLSFIVVTGGAVRLAGSGLGCPDWPTCAEGHVVAPLEFHAWVEFGNRIVTGLVSVAVIIAVLGALVRQPRRRDLTWLSLGLVGGVIAQIVLGGLVVLTHLAPPLVMSHFSLSMLIVLDAVVLHHRAGLPDDRPTAPVVSVDHVRMVRILGIAAAIVILLGTVVTASGPHPGSNKGQVVDRLPIALHQAARMHGIAVMLFLAFTLLTIWSLVRSGAPAALIQRAEILVAVLVAQAAVGYVQYFTRLPVVLVGVHIAGATAVWIATVRLNLGVRAPVAEPAREPVLAA
jgi:cytochrome c oxidase assembly protein subunit 15